MIIPTDHAVLLQSLGAYAYGTAPAELANKLQTLQGSAVDRIFTGIELLYAFREQLDENGLTLLGQMAGFVVNNQWQHPGEADRIDRIYKGVLRDVEGAVYTDLTDPDPQLAYRPDQTDWRKEVAPNLDQLKTAKRAAVNDLRNAKQNGTIQTSIGPVDGDESSKLKLNGLVTMALVANANAQPFSVSWTLANNTNVTLDAAGAIGMGVEVGSFISATHDYAVSLKGQIDAVTVNDTGDPDADLQTAIDALNAIDITTGWPV